MNLCYLQGCLSQWAVCTPSPNQSHVQLYRVFSRDVTAAMLVSLNKETAAMLVSPINPLGIELYSYANSFVLL